MVKPLTFIKSKYFLKRELFLAITIFVVVVLFSADFAFAAEMKISSQEVERIKTALDIANTASNFGSVLIDGGNLMTVLKTAVRGGQTATDVTYGLLVLSAINEMELMDLVLSGDYRDLARDYFNSILDERTNLRSYWKGVGFDIPRVVSGNITGPMGALTLNTFEMTDKVISILSAFKNLQTERRYDGLWYYFDFRGGGDSHEEAWDFARWHMQWAASPELEQQFAALYEKWGPYATPFGISKKYKEQLASELRNTLAVAIEENTENGSLYVEGPSLWDKLLTQLASIKNAITNIVSQVNPFKAGPLVELPAETVPAENLADTLADTGSPPISELVPTTTEAVVAEPELEQKPAVEIIEATTTEPVAAEIESEVEMAPITTEALVESYEVEPPKIELCQKSAGGAPKQYRVLINEVAWMGDQESFNNEWIELKNIWGIPINLSGWQLQDKDQQIKVIFGESDAIAAGGYFLLERSKDYTGALNNTDEALYLFDNNCRLEDEVLAQPNWPAGNNSDKKPMQRFDLLNWYSGSATAGAGNSSPPASLTHSGAPAQTLDSSLPAAEARSGSVVINEIAWAGTKANSADEWFEFYNNTSSAIDLTGWKIKKDNEDWIIISTSTISANGYYLLERMDNNTVSGVTADQIYTGALNNTGHKLELRNAQGNLVDSVDFSSGWPAGRASPNYISMERINSASSSDAGNWASNNRITRNGLDAGNNSINGTPKAENSVSKSSTVMNLIVSTIFDEDFTLTYLGSPYIINYGSLEVQPNVTLTIEPGVILKFNSGTKMLVYGNLLAQGSAENKIIFTSNTDSDPENNGGYYIYFYASSQGSFDNIVVRYGGYHINDFAGYRAAITFENASSTISNSLFENNFFVGLYLMSSNSTVRDTIFRDNKVKHAMGLGAYSRGLSLYNSSPILQGDYFERNYYGVFVEGTCPDLSGVTFGTGDNANIFDVSYINTSCP